MSGGCLEGVRWLSAGCGEALWRVWKCYLHGVVMLSGAFGKDVCCVWGDCVEGAGGYVKGVGGCVEGVVRLSGG